MSTIYDGNPNGVSTSSSSLPWLCFTSVENESTVSLELVGSTHPGLDLDISRDGGQTWTAWDFSTVTLNLGDRMWLRGDNNCTGGTISSKTYFSRFVMTGKIKASGSIMSLLRRDEPLSNQFKTYNANEKGFMRLFEECSSLLTPPDLPAVKCANQNYLPQYAYYRLFFGCVNLQYAPNLPAKGGQAYCYQQLFAACESLIKAPEIELTSLGLYACNNMFARCYNLRTPPSILRPTTAANYCYSSMFLECKKLQTAPKIMLTTGADYALSNMFRNCTSLKKAPTINRLTSGSFGYIFQNLFYGCTALEEAPPELVINKLHSRSFEQAFYGCINLKKLPDITILNGLYAESQTYGFNYAFAYCTSVEQPQKINYTGKLPGYCFNSAFYYCTSLKKTPALPWDTFTSSTNTNVYASAFAYCFSLEEAPEVLPAMTLTSSCYSAMFSNCYSLKRPPRLPAMTMVTSCYASMFLSCRSLDRLPELPATTLANGCYNAMFNGAGVYAAQAKGTVDMVLPAETLPAGTAYYNMFGSCPLLRSLDMRFTTSGNQSLTTANTGIASICNGAGYMKWVKVAFTSWGNTQWRNNWCANTDAYMTFYKPAELPDTTTGVSTYQATWKVVDY